MPAWPSGLPVPILSSYHVSDTLPVLRTNMQSGPPRAVRYSNHYLSQGQLTLVVNATQLAAIKGMMNDSNLGTDWITGTPIDTGGGLTGHRIRVRSIQRKVLVPPDVTWSVTISFETDDHFDA